MKKEQPKGLKYDDEKLRWDLLPLMCVQEIVKVLNYGAKKYRENSWQKIKRPQSRYYAALLRHLAKRNSGEIYDSESGLRHMAHAGCCIIFLLYFELRGRSSKEDS